MARLKRIEDLRVASVRCTECGAEQSDFVELGSFHLEHSAECSVGIAWAGFQARRGRTFLCAGDRVEEL